VLLAANDALNTYVLHQSGDGAAGNIKAFPTHLVPNLAHTTDAEVLLKDPLDLRLGFVVTLGAIR
jgi:hypothetical protein